MNERLWELLAKYWADKISPEEKAEMDRLLLEHPDHWLKTGLMQQIHWELNPLLSSQQADMIADKIINGADQEDGRYPYKKISPVYRRWKPVTAILMIVLVTGLSVIILNKRRSGNTIVWQQVTTTNGMKTTLRLADGSELWINAGSTLRYPENFNEATREVYLTGEAYFKVRHDPKKPFIIHTTGMDVKVLGTELDVRAYQDEDYSETSLIKGAVAVTVNHNKKQQQIYLQPEQKIVVQKKLMEIKKMEYPRTGTAKDTIYTADTLTRDVLLEPIKAVEGNLIPETAWKENTLLFEDEPLQLLAKRLERWYGITMIIKDSSFARQRFTGRADNVSLERLLHILQLIKPFSYSIHEKQVIIK